MRKNVEIREKIEKNRLHYYEVAAELGIADSTLCVWLRKEMDEAKKREVNEAIERLMVSKRN